MEYQYETIEHNTNVPIKIFTHTVEQFPFHWHEDSELLFVLNGSVEIRINQDSVHLDEGDLFLVNQSDIHYVKSLATYGKTQMLVLQFNNAHFNKYGLNINNVRFRLNSREATELTMPVFAQIRTVLAHMMNTVINHEKLYGLTVEKLLLELMILLLNHFDDSENATLKNHPQTDERQLNILKYINERCVDNELSLIQIAEAFYMNPQYLSRYFKNQVGISLKKFIDNMRMNKSLQALQLSNDRIIDIAYKYGFPDTKAYYRVFKELMGMTPQEYRELHKIELEQLYPKDYFSINSRETLAKLFEYLNTESLQVTIAPYDRVVSKVDIMTGLAADFSRCRRLLTFGYAPHGLRSDFEQQLDLIQREIGFEYIRFHGIFADELLLYNETTTDEPYFNFNHVDRLLDGLVSKGLKPMIELGFMPTSLGRSDKNMFWWKSNISPPKSMNNWLQLLRAFFCHIINRYGVVEIRQWLFEFWNEPDVPDVFWDGSREEFFEFFYESHRCIKAIDDKIRLGGFGNIFYFQSEEWLSDYTDYAIEKQIRLDFFSFHVYNIESQSSQGNQALLDEILKVMENKKEIYEQASKSGISMGRPGFLTEEIDRILEYSKKIPLSQPSYWITEWNGNTDPRDLVHDTCYMAAFIVKYSLENLHKVDGMGYWTFTDLFEESQLPQPLFHGGFGLLTYNGIKKAGYHAMHFMSKLGSVLIKRTESYVVTREGEDIQILLFNYCHYNNLYAHFDYSQLSSLKRYDVFDNVKSLNHQIVLDGLSGKYRIEIQRVNREQGSAYDAWVKMGGPDDLSKDAYDFLSAASMPGYRTWEVEVSRPLNLDVELKPHEIQLIQLKRSYTA